jgi:hypothetical protein
MKILSPHSMQIRYGLKKYFLVLQADYHEPAITKTMLAPKGGINQTSPYSEKCKKESRHMQRQAPNADNKLLMIIFLLKIFFINKD